MFHLHLVFLFFFSYSFALGETSLRFLVVGDIGGMPVVDVTSTQLQVARAMIARSRGLTSIINLGDNFYFTGVMSDTDPRFQTTFENVYRDTRVPWLTIAGNHDHMGSVHAQVSYTAKSKLWYFPSLYYNKIYQDGNSTIEFVMLDTVELCGNTVDVQSGKFFDFLMDYLRRSLHGQPMTPMDPEKSEVQWAWIDKTLRESTADYLFVTGHYTVYSIASQGPTQCLIERLVPLLKKYRATAYFAGHEHTLQHLEYEGVTYIISGAGSRSDQTTPFMEDVRQRGVAVHWHYPPFSLLHILSQLGVNDGGFVELEVAKSKTTVYYFNKEGDTKYVSYLRPRWMTSSPSSDKENDDEL